ncbi:interleukin-31 receptor subunit alpha [Ochotona princeps]|uniref:interleukin-31 receptor subunit alpha n=1 Tax=Ochotona princeps TaxID=9978 RepID=UPI0027153B81|nr:interleukin-31 receptor subunit alpha [Ochotona princeps]
MYNLERKLETCEINSSTAVGNRPSCSFSFLKVLTGDTFSIQVEATNAEGTTKSDVTKWRTDEIVKTEPPEILNVKPVSGVKRMIQVKWKRPKQTYVPYNFAYKLQFWAVNSTVVTTITFPSNGNAYNLTNLQSSMEYIVKLQCKVIGSKLWSDFSQEKMGMTEEEAPYGLELWRVLGAPEVDGERTVQLLWKKARGAPVLEKTLFYEIQYFSENNPNLTETENTTAQQVTLHLGCETYQVAVIAYNSFGHSPEAKLRIPAIHEKPFQCIEAMHARLAQDQLVVEWQSCAQDVDMWMVEWVPDLDSERSDFSWGSVTGAKSWTIQQDKLKPFSCYNISVYPVLQDKVGEPRSIQAYAKEKPPSNGPVTRVENIGLKTATITWEEIPKDQRNGFINNYTIFCQSEYGEEFSKTVDSSILRYDLESLKRKTSYTVLVMASTSAGGKNGTSINFKTLSMNVLEIVLITSVVGGGLLTLIVLTVMYSLRKPNKLTHLCWPVVPNPAESSIASWRGDDFKGKRYLKDDDSVYTDKDMILKSYSYPHDLIDKLVVNFGNFLEDISSEEARKGQQGISGGERNEYVTSPNRRDCPPGRSGLEGPVLTEPPVPKAQHHPSAPELGKEGTPNPYLKNSVTTREFLAFEVLPGHTESKL